jgi:Protein of unknown function (DUF1275)
MLGAASSAVLVNWGRRRRLHSQYALPLLAEAILLLCFGLLGSHLAPWDTLFVPATVVLLCFIMGLQERHDHQAVGCGNPYHPHDGHRDGYRHRARQALLLECPQGPATMPFVLANRAKLKVHGTMLAMFLVGGVTGAMGFKRIGYASTVPLGGVLIVLAIVPVIDDLRAQIYRLDR